MSGKKDLMKLKIQIEKVNMMRTDPEAPKVRAVGLAPEPLKVSFSGLESIFPAGFVLGLFVELVWHF